MNEQQWNTASGNSHRERKQGTSVFGIVLVVIGLYWLLKETGWSVHLPGLEPIRDAAYSVVSFVRQHLGNLLVPVLILTIGLVLISGRRQFGGLLLLLVLAVFLPGLILPGLFLLFTFPVLLILVGVLVIRSFF